VASKLVLFTRLPDESQAKLLLDRLNYESVLEVVSRIGIHRTSVREVLEGADGLLCRPNDGIEFLPADLDLTMRPFVAGTISSGTDHLRAINGVPGVSIQHSRGGNAAGVAELAITHAMTLTRRVFPAERAMEYGLYEAPRGTRIERKHWLVIGAGEQAAHLIAKSSGLGLGKFTVYHDRMTQEKLENCLRYCPPQLVTSKSPSEYQISSPDNMDTIVAGTKELNEVVPQADIISLHVPAMAPDSAAGRRGTVGMIDREFLAATKDPCFFINVARGNLVQERAIVDWLHARPNCGYASDVLDQEAERHRDPVLSAIHQEYMRNSTVSDPAKRLNLVLTPHIGGSAIEDFERVCNEVLDGVLDAMNVTVPIAIRRSI
jgi:phosphoglycerate dehydrogenase-like enzyme